MKAIKNFVAFSIVFMILMAVIGASNSGTSNSSSTGAYSRCKYSPETSLVVYQYQQQYPGLSSSQIAHIVCKDAK